MTAGRRLRAGWLLVASVAVHGAAPELRLDVRGLAGGPVGGGDGRSARLSVEPLVTGPIGPCEGRAKLRLRWLHSEGDSRSDADWRELAVRCRDGEHTLTVGAQQVNWGRMDLLRLTDNINPTDQHDLFYEEVPESKLALWMLNWEWQGESHGLQAVFAPQVPVDRLPRQLAGLPVDVPKRSASLPNATIALRYDFEAAGWNADLIAVHGWRSTPVLRPASRPDGTVLSGQPIRQDSVGFSADKPLGGTVLRLEGVYSRTRTEPGDMGGGVERLAAIGAGLDMTFDSWFVATQLIAQRRFDGAPDNVAYVSAIVQKKWLQDRLTARLTHLRETQDGSSWTSLRTGYELDAHTVLQLQGDVFRGDRSSTFGALRGRNRVGAALQLRY